MIEIGELNKKHRKNIFDALKSGYYSFRNAYYPIYRIRGMCECLMRKYKGSNITGVEIGVQYGHHALILLKNLNIDKLYLIDPYKCYYGYSNLKNDTIASSFEQTDYDSAYNYTREYLKDYMDRIVFIKKLSSKAVENIPNGVDFVYIDGNHSYSYVLNDLINYYPLVKKGGIIGGHDFRLSLGVPFAVIDFVNKMGIDKKYCSGGHFDWWIVKR